MHKLEFERVQRRLAGIVRCLRFSYEDQANELQFILQEKKTEEEYDRGLLNDGWYGEVEQGMIAL